MSIKSIISNFKNNLIEIKESETDLWQSAIAIINLSQECLNALRKRVDNDGFSSSYEEIYFFKNQKQIPQTELVFQASLKQFYFNIPKGHKESQVVFCNAELIRLNNYFINHQEFEQYIQLDRTDLDNYYFTRPSRSFNFGYDEPFYLDPIFSTARDLSMSRHVAFHRYIKFITSKKHKLLTLDSSLFPLQKQLRPLNWTASKTALTELIYALHYNRVINNGNSDIKAIAETLQKVLHFDLGDFYKTFSEIKSRKISRTKFLDDLSTGLISQMDKSEN